MSEVREGKHRPASCKTSGETEPSDEDTGLKRRKKPKIFLEINQVRWEREDGVPTQNKSWTQEAAEKPHWLMGHWRSVGESEGGGGSGVSSSGGCGGASVRKGAPFLGIPSRS